MAADKGCRNRCRGALLAQGASVSPPLLAAEPATSTAAVHWMTLQTVQTFRRHDLFGGGLLPMLGSAFAFRHRVFDTVSLSWSELAPRGWLEIVDAEVLGLAAQLSYYSFLALLPAILFLLALATFFPLADLTDDIGRSLGPFGLGAGLDDQC